MRPSICLTRPVRIATASAFLFAAALAYGPAPGLAADKPAASAAQAPPAGRAKAPETAPLLQEQVRLLNRLTWGATEASAWRMALEGPDAFVAGQLKPGTPDLPPEVQATIDAMQVSAAPAHDIVISLQAQQDAVNKAPAGDAREELRRAWNARLGLLSREARHRSLLRSIYSQRQLQEKMTWFWVNHFNVYAEKHAYTRPLMVDYEENAIRPRALGRFRDLLAATVYHPAMLLYLDNNQNRNGGLNENYARELLELHTLGPDGGQQQADVVALSRALTGLGLNVTEIQPSLPRGTNVEYRRRGVFEFNSARHDYEAKQLLGHDIQGEGLAEIDRVIDILARHPSTAAHISRKLAVYFVADDPPQDLVRRLSQVFQETDGDIAAVLSELFGSAEFRKSLESDRFKDPMQHVMAATRLMHGEGDPIVNPQPIVNWMNELGQGLYGRQTPEGYPLARSAWQGSGQMAARIELARQMGSATPRLYHPARAKEKPPERPVPESARELYGGLLRNALSPGTRKALEQARNTAEWNTLLLASPDFNSR